MFPLASLQETLRIIMNSLIFYSVFLLKASLRSWRRNIMRKKRGMIIKKTGMIIKKRKGPSIKKSLNRPVLALYYI